MRIGSPSEENVSGQERAPAPEKRGWLQGSSGSEQTRDQMKGELGVKEFNGGKDGLCLHLVPVRQIADSSPLSLQTALPEWEQ